MDLQSTHLSRGPLAASISNEMVQLLARHYGRGPTRARTVLLDDVVVCRLEDPYTPAEQTLLRAGRTDELRALRAVLDEELRAEFAGAVERLTGRRVEAVVTDALAEPEMVVAVFFLEARPAPDTADASHL